LWHHFKQVFQSGAIAGISVAGIAGASLLALYVYVGVYRRKKKKVVEASTLPAVSEDQYVRHRHGNTTALKNHLIDCIYFKRGIFIFKMVTW
jgi:adenine/guanine phosphoribosyltransferase-like PRPP-binding protein